MEPARSRPAYWLPLLLLAVLIGVLAANILPGRSDVRRSGQIARPTGRATGKVVELIVDFGNGRERRFSQIPWRSEMTVLDALAWVDRHRHGVPSLVRGSGDQALVIQIGDLQNQGGGDEAKNWLYEVNGEKGQESCAIHVLQPSDTVLWRFATYR